MAEACRFFDTPITGGNVSLYNETLGEGIFPTPVMGVVGLMKTAAPVTIDFKNAGRTIVLLGGPGAADETRFGGEPAEAGHRARNDDDRHARRIALADPVAIRLAFLFRLLALNESLGRLPFELRIRWTGPPGVEPSAKVHEPGASKVERRLRTRLGQVLRGERTHLSGRGAGKVARCLCPCALAGTASAARANAAHATAVPTRMFEVVMVPPNCFDARFILREKTPMLLTLLAALTLASGL